MIIKHAVIYRNIIYNMLIIEFQQLLNPNNNDLRRTKSLSF